MARDTDALKIEKWAETGDVQTPEDRGLTRSAGWPADYSQPGGRTPSREVFNQIIREITALCVEINTRGLPEWDADVSYVHPALVTGSDGNIYLSEADSNGVDPVADVAGVSWRLISSREYRRVFVGTTSTPPATWQDGDFYFQREA